MKLKTIVAIGQAGILCFLLCGCEWEISTKEESAPLKPKLSETAEMINRVKSANDRYPLSMYLHQSLAKGEMIRSQVPNLSPEKRLSAIFQYAQAMLDGGKVQEAITELEVLRNNELQRGGVNKNNRPLFDLLAVAYVRLGEVENCCSNHNEESCLFPLKGKAIHTQRRGSEQAIRTYLEILSVFPDDLQTKYLLNLAYMTLGEYPDKVPTQYLITDLGKTSKRDFPAFKEMAIQAGADVLGLSGGVCLEDFNNDGWLDIMCSSYGLNDQLKYLENDGNGKFTDATEKAGLTGVVSGLNMVHADYDNDGDQDALLLRGAWLGKQGAHPNSLLRNNGDGTFEDVAISSGIYSEHPTQSAVWADFNNDGYLDLFIGNEYKNEDPGNNHPSELFINQGNGTFKNEAMAAGVTCLTYVKGCAATDFDNDGLIDLYVSSMDHSNFLFKNMGVSAAGVPQFSDVTDVAGVSGPLSSFPCWFFDYDNDGFQDLFVADYHLKSSSTLAGEMALEMIGQKSKLEGAKLYRNKGDGTFEDVSKKVGLDRPMFAMGSNFGDLNNDGYLDFYIGNGSPDLRSIVPNLMFLNENGKRFADVTVSGRFGNLQKGHAVAFGDIDNDGDQDIYAVMGGAVAGDYYQNLLFENPGWENKWISLTLEGTRSNRNGSGAIVEINVTTKSGKQRSFFQKVGTGGSFGSSSMRLEFGLGDAESINSVLITWPNGSNRQEKIEGVNLNSHYKVVEGSGSALPLSMPVKPLQ